MDLILDFVESVTPLKNEPGGDIAMSGSVPIVRQLLAAGLLDELHLMVHPIAMCKGMRMFEEFRGRGPNAIDLLTEVRDRRDKPHLWP